MINEPLVSVLMTCYNRDKYIASAIESVLASSYKKFELIIVDDGSKDNSISIAKSYAGKDSRVRVFINEKNLGDYHNRNKAASYAEGKYLKYIDADDYLYPWGLQLLIGMMEQFPGAGYGFCSLMPDNGKWYPFKLSPEEAYRYNYFGPGIFHKAPLSAIINRDAFIAMGGFSGKRYYGDFEFWNLLSLKYDVVLMPEGMVWHRTHDEQESSLIRADPRIQLSYDLAVASFFKNEPRIPLTPEEKSIIQEKYRKRINSSLLRTILKGQLTTARDMNKMRSAGEHTFKTI